MSGGGSDPNEAEGFTQVDPNQLAQFKATTQGQNFGAGDYANIEGMGNGYYTNSQGSIVNNPQNGSAGANPDLIAAFNTWVAQQASLNTNHAAYAAASANQPGNAQTILTTPVVRPTALGGGGTF